MSERSTEYLQCLYFPAQATCCNHAIANMSFSYPTGEVSQVHETAFTLARSFGRKVCPKLGP